MYNSNTISKTSNEQVWVQVLISLMETSVHILQPAIKSPLQHRINPVTLQFLFAITLHIFSACLSLESSFANRMWKEYLIKHLPQELSQVSPELQDFFLWDRSTNMRKTDRGALLRFEGARPKEGLFTPIPQPGPTTLQNVFVQIKKVFV